MRGLFVTGTDTGVGKSVLAASICAALAESGERVAAFKPAVTGHGRAGRRLAADHELLAEAAGAGQEPADVAPYAFGPPLSPHLAAELAGTVIEPPVLLERARAAAALRPARLRGRGRPARAAHAGLPRARPGRGPGPAGGGGRPHRPRDDQPHAAHGRGRARRGPAGGRSRDDALAGRAPSRSSSPISRRSRASAASRSAACRAPRRERLAEAGAALPLADWL